MPFLDLARFDSPGSGGRRTMRHRSPWLLLFLAGVYGCSSKSSSVPVEDSLTSGRISVASAAEARTIIDHERGVFEHLYPEARIQVATRPSGEAIRALFGADCDLAVI